MLDSDQKFMQRALELAVKARGRTNPNPMVGAVIVKNGQIIGEGYHHQAGTPHAEIHALNAAGQNADGATLYVTLEPCSHYGRTPPCADAVIRSGIIRTVVAAVDPNPQVAGKGIEKIKKAGIEVEVGIMGAEAARLNEVFNKYITTGLPLTALKTAMTLDGKIAAYSGDSKWITGEDARHHVHELRNIYDAILVGIGTLLKDDPMLNTRLDQDDTRDPVRVIIDGNLQTPPDSNIGKTAGKQRTIIFCADSAGQDRRGKLKSLGIEVISISCHPEKMPLEDVINRLGRMGICSLMAEGGGEINAYLLEHGLIDKVYWFIAPKIIGGRMAPSPIGGQGIEHMHDAVGLKSLDVQRFSSDILITGYLKEWF